MKLPNEVSQNLGIDPEAEYDALFRMPPRRLARVFYSLSIYKTKTVSISIVNNQAVSFAKERGNGNAILDRGSDSDTSDDDDDRFGASYSNNADRVQPGEATIIEMESVVEMPLCMMCLHSYINTITKNFPGASQVTMYMGRDVPIVIVYRIPGVDFIGYEPPAANHMYHRKRERAEVRNEGIVDSTSEDEIDIEDEEENETDSEDGDEDEMDLEDGDGDGEEVDSVIVINRKRVWSQMMDEDEMDPQDYGGDEMEQEDGDEDEMGPQDNGGDEMEQEDGNGDEDEMGPKNGAEDEMDAGYGDGDENGER